MRAAWAALALLLVSPALAGEDLLCGRVTGSVRASVEVWGERLSTTSRPDGSFEFPLPRLGRYLLLARDPATGAGGGAFVRDGYLATSDFQLLLPGPTEIALKPDGLVERERIRADVFAGQPVRLREVLLLAAPSRSRAQAGVLVPPSERPQPEAALLPGSSECWHVVLVLESAEPDVQGLTLWIWLYDAEGRALGSSTAVLGPDTPGSDRPARFVGSFGAQVPAARFARVSVAAVDFGGERRWQPAELEGCRIPMQIPRYPEPPWRLE